MLKYLPPQWAVSVAFPGDVWRFFSQSGGLTNNEADAAWFSIQGAKEQMYVLQESWPNAALRLIHEGDY